MMFYNQSMSHRWQNWGKRFKEMAQDNGHSLASLADPMDRAESTLRSWTNGTREINLSEFFELCAAAGVNPSQVLFGGIPMNEETRQHLSKALQATLDADPVSKDSYPKMTRKMRHKPAKVS